MGRSVYLSALCLAAMLVTGCGGKTTVAKGAGAGDTGTSLPGPEGAASNGVTGMPDQPGPHQPAAPGAGLSPDMPVASDGNVGVPASDDTSAEVVDDGVATGLPGTAGAAANPDEPTPQDAAAVVRDYYAAIAAGDYDRAYGLWSDDGRASGQSPRQFAGGFADTASVSVEVMDPGRVDPAAGSRYIEVPVAVTGVHRDGSRHRYVGAYTLRRAVVDGASDEQRAWRLYSADIREVRL